MREKIVADFRFVILNPGGGRATFKIDKRPGARVKHPDLDAINQDYLKGKLDFEAARKAVEELRHRLYKEAKAIRAAVHNKDNERILERYWESEYSHRNLQDADTARYELERALSAVGQLSLYAASREELQKASDKFRGNKQRRIVAALSRLLAFIGRQDVRLRKAKKEKKRVRSLSESEFQAVLKKIEGDEIKCLAEVAFYTGARIGECFAMESSDFNEERLELKIFGQVDKKGVTRDTKNRHDRVTLVFPKGVRALWHWFDVKSGIDLKIRPHMAEIIKEACMRVFPKDPNKHLTFHDLRHSYARLCREHGLSTEDVADLIGDSIIVAKEHYSGFGPTEGIMDLRRKAIRKASKKI